MNIILILFFMLKGICSQTFYNYFDPSLGEKIKKIDGTLVLVATGWSQSSLGKMYKTLNQEKQKRAFTMNYLWALRMNKNNVKVKLIYLTTSKIRKSYRKYLYIMSMGSADGFTQFDKNCYKKILFYVGDIKKPQVPYLPDDPTQFDYLKKGKNAYVYMNLVNLISKLKNPLKKSYFLGLSAHFTGKYLETLAKTLGIPYLVNPSEKEDWIKKSLSRYSFLKSGIDHPGGTYVARYKIEEIAQDIIELLEKIPGKKIVLKLEKSAAGDGNLNLNFMNIPLTIEDIITKIRSHHSFTTNYERRLTVYGAIIEQFIEGENFTSPATISMINETGNPHLFYSYDQVLGGDHGQHFLGSIGPMKDYIVDFTSGETIDSMSTKVGLYLQTQGVRGTIGTDFVICKQGGGDRIYAIENNVRNTGTSYPIRSVFQIFGESIANERYFQANDEIDIPHIPYARIRIPVLNLLFHEFLPTHRLSINRETKSGCLIHMETFRLGHLGMICMSETVEETKNMFAQLSSDIFDYVNLQIQKPEIDEELKKLKKSKEINTNLSQMDELYKESQHIRLPIYQIQNSFTEDIIEIMKKEKKIEKKIFKLYDNQKIPEIKLVYYKNIIEEMLLKDFIKKSPYALKNKHKIKTNYNGCYINKNSFGLGYIHFICISKDDKNNKLLADNFIKEINKYIEESQTYNDYKNKINDLTQLIENDKSAYSFL